MKKTLLTIALTVLVCGCIVGSTYAWLVAKTEPLVNTFTAGNISITLEETTGSEYKMVPGAVIEKDPKVTVAANSEDCWLFVTVEKVNAFDDYMSFTIADGWTELVSGSGVYYRQVALTDDVREFPVLAGNKVTVKTTGTKAGYNNLTASGNLPTLTFTAYAVQKLGFDTAEEAWEEAKTLAEATETEASTETEAPR